MTIEQKRIKKAIVALKENKKKAQDIMRRKNGGRCCLCVMEDNAIENGLDLIKCEGKDLPSSETQSYFGWDDQNPHLKLLPDFELDAASINDSKLNVPHRIIAEFFENTFLRKKIILSEEAREYAEKLKNKNSIFNHL